MTGFWLAVAIVGGCGVGVFILYLIEAWQTPTIDDQGSDR